MPDKVAFTGIIRNVSTRIDAAGDKIGRIVIEFRPEGTIVADMDALHRPDSEIYAVLMAPVALTRENNVIPKRTKRKPQGQEAGGKV